MGFVAIGGRRAQQHLAHRAAKRHTRARKMVWLATSPTIIRGYGDQFAIFDSDTGSFAVCYGCRNKGR